MKEKVPILTDAPTGGPAATHSAEDVALFDGLAQGWWDRAGRFAALHAFNPLRVRYIAKTAADAFGRESSAERPFGGLSLLDIGCGGGIVAEPMTRAGFSVTGIDVSEESIGAARAHAERGGLDIVYQTMDPACFAACGETFDVVLAMDVIEHVPDPQAFVQAACACVSENGLFVGGSINRTLKSLALGKIAAEYVLGWVPRGAHDWRRFVRPSEFVRMLEAGGLSAKRPKGIVYRPLSDEWTYSNDVSVNYLVTAQRLR